MKSHSSNSRLINNRIVGFVLNLLVDLVLYRTIMANTMVSYWCGVVFDNFKVSVVCLYYARRFCGNGCVVFVDSNACLILTCHVLPKNNGNVVVGSTMSTLFHTGVRFDARVAYVDVGRDVALLRADSINISCPPLSF